MPFIPSLAAHSLARRYSIVLLPEHDLLSPSIKQSSLVVARKTMLNALFKKLDWRLCSRDFRNTLIWWWHSVVQVGRAREYGSVVCVQSFARRWLQRHTLTEATAIRDDQLEWVKWWKMHRDFPYELDFEKQKVCYNVRGTSVFLPTLCLMNKWTNMWMRMTKKTVTWMKVAYKQMYGLTFVKWKAEVARQREVEAAELKKILEEEEKLMMDQLEEENAAGASGDNKPWHPAIGITNMKGQLTSLPNMFCKYNANGSLHVDDFPKFNSFQVRQGGPTDTSSWLIPGQLLLGCYPEGKARMKGKQPAHSDAHAQILMSGVGTFINLMEEEEERIFEVRKGDHMKGQTVQKQLEGRFRLMRSNLKNAVTKAVLTVTQADVEVKAVPRYPNNDTRYKEGMMKLHEAVAKQGLAIKVREKAIADSNHFAKEFHFFRFGIADAGCMESTNKLVEFCEDVERRLRQGEKVYMFSR